MLSKGMVESFLLSKDEPLTPNIDGVMALWIFWRRAQTAKNLRKLDLSILVFDCFAPAPSSVRAQFFQGWHCSYWQTYHFILFGSILPWLLVQQCSVGYSYGQSMMYFVAHYLWFLLHSLLVHCIVFTSSKHSASWYGVVRYCTDSFSYRSISRTSLIM